MASEINDVVSPHLNPVSDLLMNDSTLQFSLAILIIGIIGIFVLNRKVSNWLESRKFRYTRPFATEFVKKILFALFAIVLMISITEYIQVFELFDSQSAIDAANANEELTPREIFAKILDTFIIFVIGYVVAQLIPIILSNNEAKKLEKHDYQEWIHIRGFPDDENNLFHKLFQWTPPKHGPSEMTEEGYQEKLKTSEGRKFLENYYTSKGVPIGSFKQIKSHAFSQWKKSEIKKYEKYFDDCISGNNETDQELRTGVFPKEIYTITLWREQKRLSNYEKIVPGARPPGWAERQGQETPKSFKQMIPLVTILGVLLGIAAWWEVDLVVIATASGGLAIGIGFALQETMQNYFAYLSIKKDKIFVEGDRIKLENDYVGIVQLITPRVTYVKHGLNESIAVIPTRLLIAATIINYSKDTAFVPAIVEVGASYLNDPEEVASVLMKVGKMAMKNITDVRGRHLIVQEQCPYRMEHKSSCGCDKNILVDLDQPRVRVTNFNSSSIDFSVWVFVKDYGAQFKVTSDMRIMIIKEFKKHNITIPWPIQTEYHGNLEQEQNMLDITEPVRQKTLKEYGTGDLSSSDPDTGSK
ncbi:mechanosensitive ion channel [archaeon]|nr:mechanosensitive ion channel [archaeon]